MGFEGITWNIYSKVFELTLGSLTGNVNKLSTETYRSQTYTKFKIVITNH